MRKGTIRHPLKSRFSRGNAFTPWFPAMTAFPAYALPRIVFPRGLNFPIRLVLGLFLGLFLVAESSATQGCLDRIGRPDADSLLNRGLELAQQGSYDSALLTLHAPALQSWRGTPYFRGLILLQTQEDLGDTAAFFEAAKLWSGLWTTPIKPEPLPQGAAWENLALIRALAGLQWAGTLQKRGHTWQSTRLSLQAQKALKPLRNCPEAEAALALFDYYSAVLLAKIPFVGDDRNAAAHRLDSASRLCFRLGPVLRTAWLWTEFDQGHYQAGIAPLGESLARYPEHRLYRQMLGDFQFRQGRYSEALASYRQAFSAYARPAPGVSWKLLPVGYLSCAGNLARIHAALGAKDSALVYLDIWESPTYASLREWLPPSLATALKPLRNRLKTSPSP